MTRRRLGHEGPTVSALGMGGHREGYDTKPGMDRNARFFLSDKARARVVGAAIDAGVTYFDTTFPCEIESLGTSLRLLGRREGLFVSAMRVDFLANFLRYRERWDGDVRRYTREEIDARLAESRLDHLDQFMLGAMEQGDPLANAALVEDAIAELDRAVSDGKIGRYGFSCHDHDLAAALLSRYPAFSTVMAAYNYANRKAEGSLFAAVRETGAAFVAMKTQVWAEYGIPVGALRALKPVPGWTSHDPTANVAELALRWVLANPLVSTTVPAMNTADEVRENVVAGSQTPYEAPAEPDRSPGDGALDDDELAVLGGYRNASFAGQFIPLGLAGLMSENLRVRGHAIRIVSRALGLESDERIFDADDGEQRAARLAEDLRSRLAEHPTYGSYVALAATDVTRPTPTP